MALTAQFANRTGHPIAFSTKQGREFRRSGMTAHEWLMRDFAPCDAMLDDGTMVDFKTAQDV